MIMKLIKGLEVHKKRTKTSRFWPIDSNISGKSIIFYRVSNSKQRSKMARMATDLVVSS